jgi:subtilisin family serine protease
MAVNKKDVYLFHQQTSKVIELFNGTTNKYFSLELKDATKIAQVLHELQQMQKLLPNSGIVLVQPDILQLHSKAEAIITPNKTAYFSEKNSLNDSPYIDLLDLQSLWKKTKGKGVKIAIIDDGIFLEHSDLKHITPIFSYDVERKKLSSTPQSAIDKHGTKVAGIIFSAHNNVGISGIAPEAELISIRQPDTWTSNTLLSFQLAKLAGAQIINCSWHSQLLLQPIADIIDDLAENDRQGKGIFVVISAGNNGKEIIKDSIESAIKSAIVIGASGKNFQRLAFSNYGNSVDMFTYGQIVKTTLSSGGYGVFAGTSLAAAIVSGLSALLLSQNSDLTVNQLSHQLKLITEPEKNNN